MTHELQQQVREHKAFKSYINTNEGFTQIPNTLYRVYGLLGLPFASMTVYTYLYSYRNHDENNDNYGKAWITEEAAAIQLGMTAKTFRKHIAELVKYELIDVEKGKFNKNFYRVNNPLTEAQLLAKYPEELKAFCEKHETYSAKITADKQRQKEKGLAPMSYYGETEYLDSIEF